MLSSFPPFLFFACSVCAKIVVWVHLSYDDPAFAACLMQEEDEDEDAMWGAAVDDDDDTPPVKKFTLHRMAPPGTLNYYFTVFGDGKFLLRWNGPGMEPITTPHSCAIRPVPLSSTSASGSIRATGSRLSERRSEHGEFEDDDGDEPGDPHCGYCRPEANAKDAFDGAKQPKTNSPPKKFRGGHGAILAKCSFHKIEVGGVVLQGESVVRMCVHFILIIFISIFRRATSSRK